MSFHVLGFMIMSTGFFGVPSIETVSRQESVSQEELVNLLRSLYSEIKDLEFRYEGTKKILLHIDPKDVPEPFRESYLREAKSMNSDVTYQGVFAYRNDGCGHLDAYLKPSDRTLPQVRQLASRFDSVFSRRSIVPDQGIASGPVQSDRASLSRFYTDYSPFSLFEFMWLRESIDKVVGLQYRFLRWEALGESRCLVFEVFQTNKSTGRDFWATRYWIDLERNGQPLKVEKYDESFLKSTILDVQLLKFEADDGKAIWFPVQGRRLAFSPDEKTRGRVMIEQTFSVLRGSLLVNQGLPDKRFTLDWGLDPSIVSQAKKAGKPGGKAPIRSRAESSEVLIKDALAKADADLDKIVAEPLAGDGQTLWQVGRAGLALAGVGSLLIAWRLKRRAA